MNKYYCHASGVGKIMANPRTKSEFLSKTAKTAVEEQFLYNEFGIKKDFSTDTLKGVQTKRTKVSYFSQRLQVTSEFRKTRNALKTITL